VPRRRPRHRRVCGHAGRYPGIGSWCDSADWKQRKHCIFECRWLNSMTKMQAQGTRHQGDCTNSEWATRLHNPSSQSSILNLVRGYISRMDAFDRHRVLELRQEIASLQRENESYRRQEHHNLSQANRNELRRLRLLAIKEELLRLNERQQRIQ